VSTKEITYCPWGVERGGARRPWGLGTSLHGSYREALAWADDLNAQAKEEGLAIRFIVARAPKVPPSRYSSSNTNNHGGHHV
jgi:hypothetical protein